MPISPENKKLYPKNWPEIRERIRKRAGNKCEGCGVENYSIGHRDKGTGGFIEGENSKSYESYCDNHGLKIIKIVCTVAHLDHDPTNNADENLKFWCQKCHNSFDGKHRAETRKARRVKESGQESFL